MDQISFRNSAITVLGRNPTFHTEWRRPASALADIFTTNQADGTDIPGFVKSYFDGAGFYRVVESAKGCPMPHDG